MPFVAVLVYETFLVPPLMYKTTIRIPEEAGGTTTAQSSTYICSTTARGV